MKKSTNSLHRVVLESIAKSDKDSGEMLQECQDLVSLLSDTARQYFVNLMSDKSRRNAFRHMLDSYSVLPKSYNADSKNEQREAKAEYWERLVAVATLVEVSATRSNIAETLTT